MESVVRTGVVSHLDQARNASGHLSNLLVQVGTVQREVQRHLAEAATTPTQRALGEKPPSELDLLEEAYEQAMETFTNFEGDMDELEEDASRAGDERQQRNLEDQKRATRDRFKKDLVGLQDAAEAANQRIKDLLENIQYLGYQIDSII